MNDPMTILKADHREVKAMLKDLADSEEGQARATLCEKVSVALSLHMKIEEELVYPLVKEHVGDEEDEEANVEHGLAKDGIALMVSMLTKPGFGASVEMLAGGINHHVEEEEAELLPELKSAMSRADWLSLGDQIAAIKEAAGESPAKAKKRRAAKRPRTPSRA
jgi:hemerythrin-like domain-containing protein